MNGEATETTHPGAFASFDAAVELVRHWSEAEAAFTGVWLDRRRSLVGVGIGEGDDLAATAHLEPLMPAGVKVTVRLASPEWARLRQLQVHIAHYLDDTGIWSQHAVELGVNRQETHVEIGLLTGTPEEVTTQIQEHFPTQNLGIRRNASRAIAV